MAQYLIRVGMEFIIISFLDSDWCYWNQIVVVNIVIVYCEKGCMRKQVKRRRLERKTNAFALIKTFLQSSFARYMCGQGFDTWVLEVRGAGLSTQESDFKDVEKSAHKISDTMEAAAENMNIDALPANQQSTSVQSSSEKSEISVVNEELNGLATAWDESRLVTELTQTFTRLSERLSGFLSESQSKIVSARFFDQVSRLLEDSFIYERFIEVRKNLLSLLDRRESSQIRDLSQKLVDIVDEAQRSVSPQLFDLQERLTTTLQDFEKQLDLIVKYDWDFDHYLEEDVPAAVR